MQNGDFSWCIGQKRNRDWTLRENRFVYCKGAVNYITVAIQGFTGYINKMSYK